MDANIKTITINGVEYTPVIQTLDGLTCCIVRCQKAGVHIGYVDLSSIGNVVKIVNSRRLWRWWSKFTLSGLATEGPLTSKMSEQKYAAIVPELYIPLEDIGEFIPVSEKARLAIYAVPEVINV